MKNKHVDIICIYSKKDPDYKLKIELTQKWFVKTYQTEAFDGEDIFEAKLKSANVCKYDMAIQENGRVFTLGFIDYDKTKEVEKNQILANNDIIIDTVCRYSQSELDILDGLYKTNQFDVINDNGTWNTLGFIYTKKPTKIQIFMKIK